MSLDVGWWGPGSSLAAEQAFSYLLLSLGTTFLPLLDNLIIAAADS